MRRLLMLVTLLVAGLLLNGCASEKSVPTVNLLSEEAVYTSMMMQMDSTRPDRQPDYCGVIKSINGKQVTITLAEKPVRPKLTPEAKANMRAQGHQGRQRPPLKLTAQTQDLNLASNTRIVSFSKKSGKLNLQPLAIADLKTGQVIMAWLEGEETVYLQTFPRWNQNK
ncbi:MAG: hypothetical protein ACM3O9_06385 [Methylocystaceae bacterium]